MESFNKLVRDKIPQIIEAQGEKPTFRVLDSPEYRSCLQEKLGEEVAEYLESGALDELADILEVVCALCKADGHTMDELTAAYQEKHQARGGFDQRIFLISKENESIDIVNEV